MRILLFFLVSSPLLLFASTYAELAKEILDGFETKQINSPYAKELFENVRQVTKDFTDHPSFIELERFVPRIYLEYMAFHFVKTRPNARIALIWPETKGHDEEIHREFNKYFNIQMYKRILLDKQGALNFLDTFPNISSDDHYEFLFAFDKYKDVPLRVFLLDGDPEKIHECRKNMRCMVYFTKDHADTVELAKTVFNQNSIHCIKNRIRDSQDKHKIISLHHAEDVIFTSESVLYAYGNITPSSFRCFSKETPLNYTSDREELYTLSQTPMIYSNIGFNRYGTTKRTLTTDDLLHNPRYHFFFRGVKFTTPEATLFIESILPSKNSALISEKIKQIEL